MEKALGLLFATACTEFAAYVDLAPDVEDEQSIRGYLLEPKRDGNCASS